MDYFLGVDSPKQVYNSDKEKSEVSNMDISSTYCQISSPKDGTGPRCLWGSQERWLHRVVADVGGFSRHHTSAKCGRTVSANEVYYEIKFK